LKMKSIKMVMAVCLAVGIAVLMTANFSVAADSGMGKDTVILAKGNGPGNGTGNGGVGPKDGTGNGRKNGTCTNLTSDVTDSGKLIAGRGNGAGRGAGNGTGTGPRNGTGPRGGTPACPVNPGYQS
jgi:hypothetical protein